MGEERDADRFWGNGEVPYSPGPTGMPAWSRLTAVEAPVSRFMLLPRECRDLALEREALQGLRLQLPDAIGAHAEAPPYFDE